ncbi:unnamed protein product [Peniophora sp. CBMAI 1063]|nr:unnamed protein product [Peniophora sp. CBMAI 1063]
MPASSQQRVTVFFFQELTDSSQLRIFEDFRNAIQKNWGHLFSEDGQWWGREVGKHERVWEIVFWKDEHCWDAVLADPSFAEFEKTFFKEVALPDCTVNNVPVYSPAKPFPEILGAGVNFAAYCRLEPDQIAEWIDITERLLDQLDYPGWHGGAYLSPVETGGEALSFGAWDSVMASQQLFADGRYPELMDATNEIFDKATRTFNSHVKFQKHVSS